MPTYYFHLISEGRQVEDPVGFELDSLDEAIENADLSICEIAGNTLKGGGEVQLEAIIIADDTGHELARVTTESVLLLRFTALAKFRGN
ncbi:DUF6894 family protein [Rhizobium sp. YIM 134829]|uniref:DUF6894 family protein n=1 Tax=Rhizobium sp. YIM 134829 TaxID=3390453 RepID=UPI0039788564